MIGFTEESADITVAEGSSRMVCVAILDLKSSDIDPTRNIPISISTENTKTGTCIQAVLIHTTSMLNMVQGKQIIMLELEMY